MEGESPTLRVSFKNLLLVKPMQYSHIHRTDSNEENHDAIDNDAEMHPNKVRISFVWNFWICFECSPADAVDTYIHTSSINIFAIQRTSIRNMIHHHIRHYFHSAKYIPLLRFLLRILVRWDYHVTLNHTWWRTAWNVYKDEFRPERNQSIHLKNILFWSFQVSFRLLSWIQWFDTKHFSRLYKTTIWPFFTSPLSTPQQGVPFRRRQAFYTLPNLPENCSP